jgi:hypothetical protein
MTAAVRAEEARVAASDEKFRTAASGRVTKKGKPPATVAVTPVRTSNTGTTNQDRGHGVRATRISGATAKKIKS